MDHVEHVCNDNTPLTKEVSNSDDAHVADALQHVLRRDAVTGFFNRRQFIDDFGFGTSCEHNPASCGIVAMLTLAEPSQFNNIVRALGHSFAEEFIRIGSNTLRTALPAETEIYHIGMLSFAFALPNHSDDGPPEVITDLLMRFAEPLVCNGIPVQNRIGIGMSRPADVNCDPSEVIRGAFVAAQDSRSLGKGWAWYDRSKDQAHLRSFRLLADLGYLMDASIEETATQFSLHYQPKIDLSTGQCCGAEALMRWIHPSLGFISPAEFVPLAEATAAIKPLTRWVFRQGVAHRAAWRKTNLDARISLNVSPINLAEPDFADFMLETCRENDVPPELMEIEFTESVQTMDSDLTLSQITRLRAEGVSVAIDDFGSGYSNMRYLRSIPADSLKIDKAFILTLDSCEKNQKIVPTIVDLGHRLGFKTVAEGIESQDSYDKLAKWGCNEGQGFHMCKPLPEPLFQEWFFSASAAA